LAERLKKDK
jgi:hypothetical protein